MYCQSVSIIKCLHEVVAASCQAAWTMKAGGQVAVVTLMVVQRDSSQGRLELSLGEYIYAHFIIGIFV